MVHDLSPRIVFHLQCGPQKQWCDLLEMTGTTSPSYRCVNNLFQNVEIDDMKVVESSIVVLTGVEPDGHQRLRIYDNFNYTCLDNGQGVIAPYMVKHLL